MMHGHLGGRYHEENGKRRRETAVARADGIRLWRHLPATGGCPTVWRQRREPWRLSLRPPQDRRAALQQGRKNPEAAQRRRRSRGPLGRCRRRCGWLDPWRTQFLNGADLGGVWRTRRRFLRPGGQRGKGAFAAAEGGRIWLEGTCCTGAPVEGAGGRERTSATTFVAPGV
jgi:hypothetical protein